MPNPDLDAPKAYREMLLRAGRTNPINAKPMWRVCLAQHCTRRSSGIVHELPTGDVSIFDVDAKGKVHTAEPAHHVSGGIFELPRYPVEGWISERWFPPETWGTPESWARGKAEDGSRILQSAFPHEGDYFMVGGPWEEIPEIGDLELSIRMWENGYVNRPTNMLAHYRQMLKDEEDQREKRGLEFEATLNAKRKSELVPILKSTSLAGQRLRNRLSESIGIKTHLGVVHDA